MVFTYGTASCVLITIDSNPTGECATIVFEKQTADRKEKETKNKIHDDDDDEVWIQVNTTIL